MNLSTIKIFLSIIFLLCLFDMPYGYFQLVRFIGMLGFIYLGLKDEVSEEIKYFWFASALLINPFIKIPLGRELWNIIDIFWAVTLVYTLIKKKNKKT
jgi:hypothetical protein